MKRTLEVTAVFLQVVILLAVAFVWWNRVNEDTNGHFLGWINDRIFAAQLWIERRLNGPEGQRFQAWANRYWGEPTELDDD